MIRQADPIRFPFNDPSVNATITSASLTPRTRAASAGLNSSGNPAGAAGPAEGEQLFNQVVNQLRESGLTVATGVFGAKMAVELVNDGPVTLLLKR